MSSLRRSMGVNLVFHYVGIGVALLQGIVLVPIYLRYLPLDLYGAWLAIGNVLGWLELVDPGLGSLLQQRVASTLGRAEHNRLPIVVGTGLVLGQMVAMLPLAALPFAESIARIANAPQHVAVLASSFRVGIISTCFVIASYSIFAVNLGLQRSLTAGIVNTSGSLLGLVATLVFLLKGHGLVSLPFGSLVRSTFFFVAGGIPLLIWARRNLPHLAFRTAELRELLGSASYTFVSRLGGIVVSRLDAVITAQLISPQAAAILSLTGKAMDIVRLAVERIGVAAMPGLAFVASNPDRARLVSNVNDLGRVTSRAVAVGAAAVVALNYFFLSLGRTHLLRRRAVDDCPGPGGKLLYYGLGPILCGLRIRLYSCELAEPSCRGDRQAAAPAPACSLAWPNRYALGSGPRNGRSNGLVHPGARRAAAWALRQASAASVARPCGDCPPPRLLRLSRLSCSQDPANRVDMVVLCLDGLRLGRSRRCARSRLRRPFETLVPSSPEHQSLSSLASSGYDSPSTCWRCANGSNRDRPPTNPSAKPALASRFPLLSWVRDA